jgi:hypothetical protein
MRFLAVPGAPVHTTVLGGCAHLVRVPRCQHRHWGGGRSERAAERNRILEFSSKISFTTLKYYEPDFGLPRVYSTVCTRAGYQNVAHFLHELSCQTGREPQQYSRSSRTKYISCTVMYVLIYSTLKYLSAVGSCPASPRVRCRILHKHPKSSNATNTANTVYLPGWYPHASTTLIQYRVPGTR